MDLILHNISHRALIIREPGVSRAFLFNAHEIAFCLNSERIIHFHWLGRVHPHDRNARNNYKSANQLSRAFSFNYSSRREREKKHTPSLHSQVAREFLSGIAASDFKFKFTMIAYVRFEKSFFEIGQCFVCLFRLSILLRSTIRKCYYFILKGGISFVSTSRSNFWQHTMGNVRGISEKLYCTCVQVIYDGLYKLAAKVISKYTLRAGTQHETSWNRPQCDACVIFNYQF